MDAEEIATQDLREGTDNIYNQILEKCYPAAIAFYAGLVTKDEIKLFSAFFYMYSVIKEDYDGAKNMLEYDALERLAAMLGEQKEVLERKVERFSQRVKAVEKILETIN